MENFDEYFKQPTQEETDKAWLRQLCYDGQMDDDEIDEFVEAVYQWKERCVEQNPHKHSVSGKRPTEDVIDKADGMYQALQKLLKDLATDGTAIEGFTDAWNASLLYQQAKLSAACASGAVDKTVSDGFCNCLPFVCMAGSQTTGKCKDENE